MHSMNARAFFGCIVLLSLPSVSIAQASAKPAVPAPGLALAPAAPAPVPTLPDTHGLVLANIDHSVKPGDDFYLYANGKWQARTEIPADRNGLSSFSILADVVNARVAGIIASAAKSNAPAKTDQRRIADLYHSYIDEATINSRGLTPIKPQLAAIAAIHGSQALSHALGLTLRADVDALNNTNFHTPNIFGLWVAPSFNDPEHYAPYLLQGGLTLPAREYYLVNTPNAGDIRKKYFAHATAMFKLAGFDHPEQHAIRALNLEQALAAKQTSLADSENIHRANNTWTMDDFDYNAPGVDWKEFFAAAGLGDQKSFIVWQPSAVAGEAAIIASADIDAWQDYLVLHLLEGNSAALPKAFADEHFAFFGTVLSGAPQQRPLNERATLLVNSTLGEAVGKLYAQQYFPPEQKAQVKALVANLMVAFHKRLENLTWMTPATKTEAIAKLDKLQIGIGYPDTWRSYDGLDIQPNDLFGNLWRSSLFEYHYQLSRIGKPVDRKEWCMNPQTVNAVNLPLDNGLNFPAAILLPPFYDPKAPDAFNYGALGSVIGHEISHTFDSEGAAFDSHGKVRNWWTKDDFDHFQASTAALVKQYDAYKPFPDLALRGAQTLGENIADVAGLLDSYDAFHASLNGKPAPVVDGLSGDQQFFLAYAQNRTQKSREAALRQQILTDPHSPGEYRADTVRNLDAWYPAFNVQPTDKLYLAPADRVKIW
jgi:putative endopeptidase